ncbi:MAG: FumA C-terminus/TtdB family hydratase beta subunit [Thermoproteota archaeon]
MAEYRLRTPIGKSEVRSLRVGDVIYISGEVFTIRDRAQKKILEEKRSRRLPFSLEGLVEYHAGPIVRRTGSGFEIISLGPTTSLRMEPWEYEFIRETGISGVVGKGGMGDRTRRACMELGAFYGVLPGGAAALLAKRIRGVKDVYWVEEMGVPEATWHLEVDELGPIIVVIDSEGNDLYDNLRKRVSENLSRALGSLGVG